MENEKELERLLKKADELGKAQGSYAFLSVFCAVSGYVFDGSEQVLQACALLIPLFILAWFGVGRAAAEIQPRIKELAEDYNYGMYGGAPPFIWAIFYAPHGKKGFQRNMALLSFPIVFTILLFAAGYYVGSVEPAEFGILLAWGIAAYRVGRLWVNRVKAL